MSADMVVTSTPTIMSGYVVRWFTNTDEANRCEPVISASRDRVLEHQPDNITPELRDLAERTHDLIKDWYRRGGHDFKVWMKYVTHDSPLLGDVVPARYNSHGEKL